MTFVSYVFIRNELTSKLNVYLIRNKDITIELMFPYPMQSDWDLYKIMKKKYKGNVEKHIIIMLITWLVKMTVLHWKIVVLYIMQRCSHCGVTLLVEYGTIWKSDSLNKCFASVFTQDNSPTLEIEVIPNLRCHPLKFTQKGVISSFKPKGTKATGPDKIPSHLLKEVGRLPNCPCSHFTI